MPRYFFNVRDHELLLDKTGLELSGPVEARRQALEVIKLGKRLLPQLPFCLVVTDEEDKLVLEVRVEGKTNTDTLSESERS
jgi:hypothetical protein